VVAVKVHAELFAAALSKRAIMEAWEGGKDGDSKTSVVETNVSQSAGSKASLAEVGLMAPSDHLHAQGGVRDRGLVFLWQVKLALLLEARADAGPISSIKTQSSSESCRQETFCEK